MSLRMFLTVVGILTLSVLSDASDLLFRVDIVIPQKEGRKESEDIQFVRSTLSEATGVNVVIERKAFDNQNFFVVVEVQEICAWSSLSSDFSEKGYELTVTPLQSCSDYAMELGVNVTYQQLDKVPAAHVVDLFNVVFHDEGMDTEDYMALIKKHFEKDGLVKREGLNVACYRIYGELPVRLMYLDHLTPKKLEDIYQEVIVEGKASIMLTRLQCIDVYTEHC